MNPLELKHSNREPTERQNRESEEKRRITPNKAFGTEVCNVTVICERSFELDQRTSTGKDKPSHLRYPSAVTDMRSDTVGNRKTLSCACGETLIISHPHHCAMDRRIQIHMQHNEIRDIFLFLQYF